MRYAFVAAVLVGAVAASPAWSPPAYGGSEETHVSSAPAEGGYTTVVTVTSCAATVTDCPAGSPSYPATTSAAEVPVPTSSAYSPEQPSTSEVPYSPEQPSESAPVESSAPPAAETPYSPEQPSVSAPVGTAPPAAETPYSPVGSEAPPAYGTGAPSYPVPGNGTYGNPTASGAPSASQNYPVQQTGNSASGLKAGSFLAGCGAVAALLL